MKVFGKLMKINKFSHLPKLRPFGFLNPKSPWSSNQDVAELPPKDAEFDYRRDSKRTYTKWFNPMTFDPRTPDYFETVRSEWQEDVTREDFGESKHSF